MPPASTPPGSAETPDHPEIVYRVVDTPIGSLFLAASAKGLVRVAFANQDLEPIVADLAVRMSPRVREAPQLLAPVARQLDEYFAGRRHQFDVPLDFSLSVNATGAAGFRLEVQHCLLTINYGQTQSYSDIATQLGKPKAVRAVGTACATNPLPIIVPCHRVLRSDGSLGGYAGGLEAKKLLLGLEQQYRGADASAAGSHQ